MKVKYRGFEIEAKREKCLAGYSLLYFYVMRICDGWFMADGFTEGEDKIRDFIRYMKDRVDEYHLDPTGEEDEDFFDWFGEGIKNVIESGFHVVVHVCEVCARPYVLYDGSAHHQVDSDGRKSGKPCCCGGGED
jgi:hypothetical protein